MGTKSEGEKVELKRELGLFQGCTVIVGIMIGSGIFVTPKGVTMFAGSVGLSLLIWALSGLLSLMGALGYAELGTLMPQAGSQHLYIKKAYGEFAAFMCVWGVILIVVPCSGAVGALTFAHYLLEPIFPRCEIPHNAALLLAVLAIALLCFLNAWSLRWGVLTQGVFTVIKTVALASIIITGIVLLAQGRTESFQDAFSNSSKEPGAIALAFYSGIFSYGGWECLNPLTEELKNPYKTLPRAIMISVPLVTLMYVLANIGYFSVMTEYEMIHSDAVAVTFASRVFGAGAWVMPILVACSIFGNLNGCIMSIARLYYGVAMDGHLPGFISLISVRHYTPMVAILTEGLITILMLFLGDVYELINHATFVMTVAYFVTTTTVLYFRWKAPDAHRPIKVPLFIPIIFVLVAAFLIIFPIIYAPKQTLTSILLLLSGVPAYLIGIAWVKKPMFYTLRMKAFTSFVQKMTVSCHQEGEE